VGLTLAWLAGHSLHTPADWVVAPAVAYGVTTIYLAWENLRAGQQRRKAAREARLSDQLSSAAHRQ
jgi:uncharacterized membrane protein